MRSPIPLAISAALFGCPNHGETCGASANSGTLTASATNISLSYGGLSAGLNNDCPAHDGSTVVSLTITGNEITSGSGFGVVTFCVPRPDLLESMSQAIGGSGALVQVVDVTGADASCTYALDSAVTPSGTLSSTGMCDDGSNAAGFTLTVDGAFTLDRTCGSAKDTVSVMLTGSTDVLPMKQ